MENRLLCEGISFFHKRDVIIDTRRSLGILTRTPPAYFKLPLMFDLCITASHAKCSQVKITAANDSDLFGLCAELSLVMQQRNTCRGAKPSENNQSSLKQ